MLCQCGCGRETRLAEKAYQKYGLKKGEPRRFVSGHHRRKKHDTYTVYAKEGRHEYLHRVRAERALGKPLPPGAVVHHADGSRSDDAPLVICQNQAYHVFLHARMRIRNAGGNPNTDKICTTCKKVLSKASFQRDASSRDGFQIACKACRRQARLRRIASAAA